MALFGLLKKKEEKKEPAPAPPTPAPIPPNLMQQVQELQKRGMSDAEIVQYYQAQGIPPQQIYDALSQSVVAEAPEPYTPPEPEPSVPEQSTEEVVESIVEERWTELQSELQKFTDWKSTVQSRLDKLEQSFNDLRADVENLHKALVSKLGEYDKSLVDVGTEIKAMEKVFQKVLPELTSSVQTLSAMTKGKESK